MPGWRGASRALASGVVKVSGGEVTELAVDGSFTVSGPLETFANAGGVHVGQHAGAGLGAIGHELRGVGRLGGKAVGGGRIAEGSLPLRGDARYRHGGAVVHGGGVTLSPYSISDTFALLATT